VTTVSRDVVLRQLAWRYAVKKFDAGRKIAPADWDALEQALVLTPSSFGLQPWRFVVVENPATRKSLRAASWNQSQIEDASHLVVLAIRHPLTHDDVVRWIRRLAEVRGVSEEGLAGFRKMIDGWIAQPKERFDAASWCARQAYIALGQLMTAAALMGIDTCPMEGLDPVAYDRILDLPTQGYSTVVACVLGYRAADDASAALAKARFARSEVVTHVR
jgi:nitroreductase